MARTKQFTAGAVVGSAFLLMGLSMPSCPGQQETEKKLQDLSAKIGSTEKSISGQNDKMRALEGEVGELKKALQEVAEVLKTHKGSIDELTTKITEMSKSGGKKAPAKRR